MIDIKIEVSKSICVVVFMAVFFRCVSDVLMAYSAAFIHELAHLAVCRLRGVSTSGIRVSIAGMRLDTDNVPDTSDRIAIFAAGPLASLLMFAVSAFVAVVIKSPVWLFRFSFVNLCIAGVNSLPITPLDGGNMLKALLVHHTGVIRGNNLNKNVKLCFLVLIVVCGVWLIYKGCMSISFGVVVLFLIMSFRKEDAMCICEKQAVLCGKYAPGTKIRYITADSGTRLQNLVTHVSSGFSVVTAVFEKGRFVGELHQDEILRYISKHGPVHTAGECLCGKNSV